jgi:hypothetical protein
MIRQKHDIVVAAELMGHQRQSCPQQKTANKPPTASPATTDQAI